MKKIEAMCTTLVGVNSVEVLDYSGQWLPQRIVVVALVLIGISLAMPFFLLGRILNGIYRSLLGWMLMIGVIFELNFGDEERR